MANIGEYAATYANPSSERRPKGSTTSGKIRHIELRWREAPDSAG